MARPIKGGLDYFPMDVDFFEDDKIQLIDSEFGEKGVLIAIRLLSKIYKENGYYYQWGYDECLLFSRNAGKGIVPSLVGEVLNGLIRRSFFDKGVFEKFKILTSNGIQKRFLEAKKRSENLVLIQDILLINTEMPVNVTLTRLNATLTADNVHIGTQSKVKESKGKESIHTQEQILLFKSFSEWLNKNAPRVQQLKDPLTIDEYFKLKNKIPKETLANILMSMQNKLDLTKRYVSANLTILNWSKREIQNEPTKDKTNVNEALKAARKQ
jgi:Domain of unknown function (DUF4373)